jgi:hypothetical protein
LKQKFSGKSSKEKKNADIMQIPKSSVLSAHKKNLILKILNKNTKILYCDCNLAIIPCGASPLRVEAWKSTVAKEKRKQTGAIERDFKYLLLVEEEVMLFI